MQINIASYKKKPIKFWNHTVGEQVGTVNKKSN